MLLSEAISLGHTLIGEGRDYYCELTNCGCAIGSAAAALGKLKHASRDFRSIHTWFEDEWPWTQRPATDFPPLLQIPHPLFGGRAAVAQSNVANAISYLHCNRYLNRLEIAALIAKIEPPEPGLAASSHSPAPATVEVSA